MSLEVIHFCDALIAILHDELQSILIELFQQGQDRTENIFIASVRVIVVIRLLLSLFEADGSLLGGLRAVFGRCLEHVVAAWGRVHFLKLGGRRY